MLIFALLATAHASCIDAPGFPDCGTVPGDVCLPSYSGDLIDCDLDVGSIDSAHKPTLTVTWDASGLDTIEGRDSSGEDYCCDAAELGTAPALIRVHVYNPATVGYLGPGLNTIDLTDARCNTTVYGGYGDELVYGADDPDHTDIVYAGAGNDEVYGNAGPDDLIGSFGYDHLYGGAGDDTIYASDSAGGTSYEYDYLDGGDDNDHLYGSDNVAPTFDYMLGGNGGDEIWAYGGPDVLCGGGASDLLEGGVGSDILYGGPQYDVIHGGGGVGTDDCEAEYMRTGCEAATVVACPAP